MADFSDITVGMDIGYDAVRMVALVHTDDGQRLHRIGVEPYQSSYTPVTLFQHADEIAEAVRRLVASHYEPDWPVTFGLRNRFATVIIPPIEKKKSLAQNYDWINWEAVQCLDESLDHYIIDVALSGYEDGKTQDALVVAARREPVGIIREIAEAAGLENPALTVASVALINGFGATYNLSAWETASVVHIEPGAIDMIFIRDTQVKIMVMPIDMSSGDEETGLQMFGDQFRFFLNDMTEEETPDTIYVSGTHRQLQKLCSTWGEQLNRRVTQATPFQKMEVPDDLKSVVSKLNPSAYMVAVGLGVQRPA